MKTNFSQNEINTQEEAVKSKRDSLLASFFGCKNIKIKKNYKTKIGVLGVFHNFPYLLAASDGARILYAINYHEDKVESFYKFIFTEEDIWFDPTKEDFIADTSNSILLTFKKGQPIPETLSQEEAAEEWNIVSRIMNEYLNPF